MLLCSTENYVFRVAATTNTGVGEFSEDIVISKLLVVPPEPVSPWISLTSGNGSYNTNEATATLIHGISYVFTCWIHGADPDLSIEWSLRQKLSAIRMETAANAEEILPDCLTESISGTVAFTANLEEHLEQTLTCRGSNDYFMIQRNITLLVQVALFTIEECMYVVNEGTEEVRVRVNREPNVGDVLLEDRPGSIRIKTSPINATSAFDFESRDEILDFARGVTQRLITIALSNNREPEGAESFQVSISEPTGGRLGDCSQANIIIVDDDSVYTFAEYVYNVLESDGAIAIEIHRDGMLETQGSVGINVVSTAARQDDDYTTASPNTLEFSSGSSDESFVIVPVDDFSVEDVETIQLYLVNPVNGFIGGLRQAEIILTDDDATYCLDVFPKEVFEVTGNEYITATVTRKGYLLKEATVYLRTIATQRVKRAAAVANEDFIEMVHELTFSPGQSVSDGVQITILDDDVAEPTKTFAVEIYGIPEEAIGEQTQVEVTIRNDFDHNQLQDVDVPRFGFDGDTYRVLESDEAVQITVIRDGNLNQAGSIEFFTGHFSDGDSARSFYDFQHSTVRLHFEIGESSKTEKVTIVNDEIIESTEKFWVGLRNPLGGKLGNIDTATVIIEDDEVVLSFEHNEYNIAENSDVLQIPVRRSGFSGPLTLNVNVNNRDQDSALEGEDFRIPSAINFLDGIDNVNLDVIIIDDEVKELRETFQLEVTRDGNILSLIRVTIVDNDEENAEYTKEGLSDTMVLLIAFLAVVVVITLIAGVILIALCWRFATKPIPPVRPQVLPMKQIYPVTSSLQTPAEFTSNVYNY